MSHGIEGVTAMSVHVNDMDRARKFCANALGLEELSASPDNSLVLFGTPGGTPIALHDWTVCKESGARPPGTVSGIIFHASDPTKVGEEVKKHGGSMVQPLMDGPTGGKFVVIADPDGNEYIVATPPG